MKTIQCVRCGTEVPYEPHRRYCDTCRWEALPIHQKNQRAVRAAIVRGDLPPLKDLACVDCGAPAACYEHRDITKALDVVPTCKKCNFKRGPALWPKSA